MKKLILTALLTLFISNIFAQGDDIIIPGIGFGLKAGLNSMHNKTVNETGVFHH
jgi:hypothetical protein